MKTCFITFGAVPINPSKARFGEEDYYGAVARLTDQAKSTKLFDIIKGWTDIDLKDDNEFWPIHKDFICGVGNRYGFGYYIWKPYIIKRTLDTLSPGDVLLYLDAGCEINFTKGNILEYFIESVPEDLIIGSETQKEFMWSSVDLMKRLNVFEPKFYMTPQRQAGTNMFYVCDQVVDLVNRWYDMCCKYDILIGNSFKCKNIDGFKGYRHDQSIFSLLTKKYKFNSWVQGKNIGTAVEIIWNRSGKSKLNI